MTVEIYSNNSEQQTMVGNPVQFVGDDSSPVDNFTASVDPSLNGVSSVQVTNNGRVTTAPLGMTLYAGTANITDGLITATYDGQLYNPSAIPADLNSIILANTEEKNASGDIASFNCQLGEYPVKDLTVAVEPVQDLHGYPNPWPAGGGKNLYNANALNQLSSNGITATVSNGTITLNGTATANAFFTVRGTGLPSGNYAFSFNNPVASSDVHVSLRNSGDQYFSDTAADAVNKSLAFTGEPTDILLYVKSGATMTNFVVKPQLETGSTPTAWTPYSNICPISGHTDADVVRTGKNLLPNNMVSPTTVNGITATKDQDGSLTLTGHGDGNVNPFFYLIGDLSSFPLLLKAGQYVLDQGVVLPTNNMLRIGGASEIIAQCQGVSSISFTLTKDTYVCVYMRIDKSADFTTPVKVYPTIRISSEADTTYQAYSGETLSVSWQDTAGTVYGGSLDVTNGVLTVDRKYFSYSSAQYFGNYGDWNKPLYYVEIPDAQTTRIKPCCTTGQLPLKCNYFNSTTGVNSYTLRNNEIRTQETDVPTRFYFRADEFADINAVNAALASTPLQVVAYLATPIVIQLDPVTVQTLLGQNNIWADCGPSTVEYRNGRINETSVLTQSNALISGEQVTYPLSLPIILSGNRTPIYTYPGKNNMSANVNSFSVTWSKHWFDITPWIAWQGLTFSRNDVDAPNAGRDMSGYMHRGRVASKEKMNIQTVQLTRAQSSKLQTLLFPETIMVRVTPYPRTNAMQVLYMYSNNVKTTYVIHRESGEDLQSLSFPLIEN